MKHYTKQEMQFIRENYNQMTNAELAEKLNRTPGAISAKLVLMKLTRDGRKQWTQEELQHIQDLYKSGKTLREIASILNVSFTTIKGCAGNHKILSGRTGCYPKGHRPWNFRKKGINTGGKETQFKKGHLPHNTLHDGAITLRYDNAKTRKGRPYYWIRTAMAKWVPLHRYLWEQHQGEIPKRMIVAFKDGNSLNCTIDNLELITMAENARRNYDPAKAAKASKELTDNYVAGRIAKGDKKLRKAIINGAYELVELKRKQLTLKRKINERHNKARKTDR